MKNNQIFLIVLIVSLFSIQLFAQKNKKVTNPPQPAATCYPTHWWPGMQWNKVQVLVKGKTEGFNRQEVMIEYPGVSVEKVTPLENSMYYAIDLSIAPDAKPGTVVFNFIQPASGKKKTITTPVEWPLKTALQTVIPPTTALQACSTNR
ncbi:MAG: cyclomaltodextrinase N-terminal domain-containing protein [Chitinophagaceae bacterium]|nr:cyclomaltodextrinase N-terminal domain-containing protein [Chitinophagaceae bacterium]